MPTTTTTAQSESTHPALPALHFSYSRRNIFLHALFLLTCNLIIPLNLFYSLVSPTKLTPKAVIGISSAALGISPCFDYPMRLYRLFRRALRDLVHSEMTLGGTWTSLCGHIPLPSSSLPSHLLLPQQSHCRKWHSILTCTIIM
ncbi:hypothetical protein HYPSUDRAFT_597000 [Hypholoma sublateritium FD-334 SS-4]|uniref:Uncharacterized protein n=1 Tax=Hypholoma sublateritium (strain FD-334 SS-4) TaxID=945553 RepID=A0A0D2P3P6_HYPSF|nr:hypothetical protein HYPSUDRAFT_597000 [Hypholoma sublateritium FD-334 SS-4]